MPEILPLVGPALAGPFLLADLVPGGTVVITPLAPPGPPVVHALSFVDGYSTPIPLPGTGLSVRIPEDMAIAGNRWSASHVATPTADLADALAALEALPGDTLAALFGSEVEEPYASLRWIWEQSDEAPCRLAAAALALARRTDDLRTGAAR